MSVLIKNLGAGSLDNTTAATPGPGAGKSWIVKSIILTNRDTVARAVNVKIVGGTLIPGATSGTVWLTPVDLVIAPASSIVLDDEITLQNPSGGTAQSLNISAPVSATTIDVVINGLERDI